jgi:hypothetical protein
LQRNPDGLLVVAWLGAALFLVRPECLLVIPLYLMLQLRDRRRRQVWASFLVFGGVVVGTTLARLAYFGTPFPISALSKATRFADIAGRALDSLTLADPNLPPPFAGVLALALMVLGAVAWHRRQPEPCRFAIAWVATELLFSVYAPVDWTGLGRYFAPAIPVAMLLLALGCHQAVLRIAEARPKIQTAVTLALVLALGVGGFQRALRVLSPQELDRFPGFILKSDSLIPPARWIAAHVPETSVIATRRIGVVGFVTHRHIYDYAFGLTDAAVARIVAHLGPLDNPDHPALEKSWLQHAPDFILEDASTVARWVGPRGDPTKVRVHGTLYRERRRFPIGEDIDWCLLEAAPAGKPRPVKLSP